MPQLRYFLLFYDQRGDMQPMRRLSDVLKIGFFFLILPGVNAHAQSPTEREHWSPSAAQDYLESRSTWWLSWDEAALKNQGVCLSCHTTVPYMLARAALRSPSSLTSDKLLRSVQQRVRDWNQAEPYQPSSPVASRGTESVLNALVLASEDKRLGRQTPSAETNQALAHLWTQQQRDQEPRGAWTWFHFGLAPWESHSEYYGASMAALAIGTAPGYLGNFPSDDAPRIAALREYLQTHFSKAKLHHRLVALWAARSWPGLFSDAQRQQALSETLKLQQADGGWSSVSLLAWQRSDKSTIPTTSDGYATAVVLLAFQGNSSDEAVTVALRRAVTWLDRNQRTTDGAWPAESMNSERTDANIARFMRDAATAFALLALSEK